MIEYVKKAFQNYTNFKGRATRPEFWWFFLFIIIGFYGLLFLSVVSGIFTVVASLFYLGCLLPYLAVAVRRLHDVGKSGWFILIPIYNLILFCTEGDNGTNEYGPNPNNPTTEFDFEKQSL